MDRRSFRDRVGLSEDIIDQACTQAMEAHNSSAYTLYHLYPSHTIFAFPGSWSLLHWYNQKSFGESNVNLNEFPSLMSVVHDKAASANNFFMWQFESAVRTSNLHEQVKKAMAEKRQIVFTGHSSGGSIAVLTAVWILEQHRKLGAQNQIPLFCVTFGSPLVGDRIFGHAIEREGWSRHFIHFYMRYDIVPRILLAPLSAVERELHVILQFLNPKSAYHGQESIKRSGEASFFYTKVMGSALSVVSHAACLFMGSTNLLLEAMTSFVELSPYRPFGTCIFCTENGKSVAVKNSDAVLQLLFYSLQLSPEQKLSEISSRSLENHLVYKSKLQASLRKQNMVYLDNPAELPLSAVGAERDDMKLLDMTLNDLGLSTQARICLRAAGELEKQKHKNQEKIDANSSRMEEGLKMLQEYQTTCEVRDMAYYDAFKFQRESEDFQANVKRLELAGMWDEIIDMLMRYELPDGFEARMEWVDRGTRYRHLVEPLDIANYYRHSMNDDTGPYIKVRPTRYKYTQRWFAHTWNLALETCSESCFWARVEELLNHRNCKRPFEEVEEKVIKLEMDVLKWVTRGEISKDVFLEDSTFVKWWKTLPQQHIAESCLAAFMNMGGRNHCILNYTD
ncbi:hypothetical protein Scep_017676 [Stephania cephalantha]|uniref:Uncharacterized protein n=1 Tax=Stephania cephalantha TaxID=152367 RepID=A0AAP0IRB5_9MAGN